jgi:hypothetical protein
MTPHKESWIVKIDEFIQEPEPAPAAPTIVEVNFPQVQEALLSAELAMERAAQSAAEFAERTTRDPKSGAVKHGYVRRRLESLAKMYEPSVGDAISLLIPFLIEQAVLRLRRR